MPALSMCRDLCLIPEPCSFARALTGCRSAGSVYPVAADGEAVYFQQIFLRLSVFKSVPFQSRVGVYNFVVILVWRRQEGVRFTVGDAGREALWQVGGLHVVGCRERCSFFSCCFWLENAGTS